MNPQIRYLKSLHRCIARGVVVTLMVFVLSLASAQTVAAQSIAAQNIVAQNIAEQGDAGNSVATAQQLPAISISLLTGNLDTATDIDLYLITIDDHANFSASTTAGPGTADDTRLYLFTADGHPVYMNDDDPNDNLSNRSLLPAGHVLGPQSDGDYILGVSVYYMTPVDASANQLFVEPDDEADPDAIDYTTVNGPTSAFALSGWNDNSDATLGSYGITITGVNGSLSIDGEAREILDDPLSSGFSLFPNPAATTATVILRSARDVQLSLQLFALNGQQISSTRIVSVPGGSEQLFYLDVSSVASGTYLVRISGGPQAQVLRLVVIR